MCKIRFSLDEPSFVTIKVVNVIGIEVATLINEDRSAGYHEIDFSVDSTAGGLPPGAYYYKIYVNKVNSNGSNDKENKVLHSDQILEDVKRIIKTR